MDPGDSAPAVTPAPAPLAPTPSPGPGKIQKSSKRQVKTAPETIAKALDSIPEFKEQQTGNGKPNGLSPYIGNSPDSLSHGANASSAFLPQGATLSENAKSQGGSCCSGKSKPPPPPPQPQSSCCKKSDSPTKNGHSSRDTSESPNVSYASSLNGNSYTPVSTAPFSPWQGFQTTGQNHYMPAFSFDQSQTGTPSYPHNFLSQIPSNGSLGFSNDAISSNIEFNSPALPSSLSHDPQTLHHPTPGNFDSKLDHDCSCGEGCQCLGCASHPFNNTTRQHVQEMGLLVALDGEQTLEGFNGFQSPPLPGNYPSVPPMNYSLPGLSMSNGTQQMGMQPYGEVGTSSNPLRSGYSSPPAEYTPGQTLMEPSEYYTLEYPVGLPSGCSDVTGSCQCGNDCCCVGCLTHSGHDGFALETTTADSIEAPTVTAGELDNSTHGSSSTSML